MLVAHDHLIDLGNAVLKTQWLKQLRTELRIGRRHLAEMIGVSTQTIQRWEAGNHDNVWSASSRRIGEFYSKALPELERVHQMGDQFNDYFPSTTVASLMAQPTFIVEKMCERGDLECLNLGVLGVFLKPQKVLSSAGSR